jgi:hypothetical protein
MSWFDRFRRRDDLPTRQGPTAQSMAELEAFLAGEGVEAYMEPPTQVYAMTLCVVAPDGEFLRRPVRDERHARALCAAHGVPLYDARKVGYPKRMKEYQRGIRQQRVSLEDLPPLEVTDERED